MSLPDKKNTFNLANTDMGDSCPITGLIIKTKPEWLDIKLNNDFEASLYLIGDRIVLTTLKGNTGTTGVRKLTEKRKEILKELNLWDDKYIDIVDYSGLEGNPGREARNDLKNYILQKQSSKNLLGYFGFNTSFTVRAMFNVAKGLYAIRYPIEIVRDYQTAIEKAVETLIQAGIGVYSGGFKSSTRDDWKLALDNYGIRFELIGDEILHTVSYGALKDQHVDSFYRLNRKVLSESGITGRGDYYRVVNWENMEQSSWRTRTLYIESLKKLERDAHCRLEVFYGHLNKSMTGILNVSGRLMPFETVLARDFHEAMELIAIKKREGVVIDFSRVGKQRVYTAEKVEGMVKGLLRHMGELKKNIRDGIPEALETQIGVFGALCDALSIIKIDLLRALKEKDGIFRDIEENELRFRMMFEHSSDLMAMANAEERILWSNRAWQGTIGYLNQSISSFFEKVDHRDRDRVRGYWKSLVEGSQSPGIFEYRYQTENMETIDIETTATKVETRDDQVIFLVSQDLTGRKKAQKEKEEMQHQIFQGSKMAAIGELAAGVGHEINNPNAIIQGNIEIGLEKLKIGEPGPDELDRILAIIEMSSRRITNIVKGLSVFARSSQNSLENMDCRAIMEDTISLVGTIYSKEGIKVKTDFCKARPIVYGNTGEFQQVIMNLLSNAKDAVFNQSEKVIEVKIESSDREVVIQVSDNGCGIDEEKGKQIFELFFTSKEVGRGTGLGLSLSRSFVEAMNGTIDFKSEVGKGSTFRVRLPLSEGSVLQLAKESRHYTPLRGRVLIVEDEEAIREILKIHLTNFGLEVEESGNGLEALENMEKKSYDYLITDLTMPVMNGEELLERVKTRGAGDMKIIVLTGRISVHGDQNDLSRLPGVDAYIQKPFSPGQIFQAITAVTSK